MHHHIPCPLNLDIVKLFFSNIASKELFKEPDPVLYTCLTPSNLSKTSPFLFTNLQAKQFPGSFSFMTSATSLHLAQYRPSNSRKLPLFREVLDSSCPRN